MDEIIDLIACQLETDVVKQRGIKAVYKGNPFNAPQVDLPCIIIVPDTSTINTVDSGRDETVFRIFVIVALDAREYLNAKKRKVTPLFEVAKIMEQVDTDGSLKTDTVAYSIRHNFDADNDVLKAEGMTIRYAEVTEREYPVSQGVMEVEITTKTYDR